MNKMVFLLVMLLLTACTSTPQNVNEFDQNVSLGKVAMKNEYYRAALYHFEKAKIDQPNDADLKTLTEMAESKIKQSLDNMKPRSSLADTYEKYESIMRKQGKEPSWREWELDRLNQTSKRDDGVDTNGDTFEDYVTQAELAQTEPGKLNDEQLLDDWLLHYDH
ncbi:hypothetical protein [Paenibacillus sp. WLX2291]|uniref:hypothetical protein n=1 Tax=Paenibacillus sp. WLX2291 TaxID=3296934 RepID=UPI003983E5D9